MTGTELIENMGLDNLTQAERERSDPEWLERWDKAWAEVKNWSIKYYHMEVGVEPLRRMHALLKHYVPVELIKNGAEQQLAVIHPDRAPGYLRGAARLLHDDEFLARIEGEPQSEAELWRELRPKMQEVLAKLLSSAEVTDGDPRLSLRAHASTAATYLELMEFSSRFYASQQAHQDDREWLSECFDEFAFAAFLAGYYTRAAQVKELEPHTVRGMKVIRGSQLSGEQAKARRSPTSKRVLQVMKQLIDDDWPVSTAALIAHKRGLGTSRAANSKLWYYHRSKKV